MCKGWHITDPAKFRRECLEWVVTEDEPLQGGKLSDFAGQYPELIVLEVQRA